MACLSCGVDAPGAKDAMCCAKQGQTWPHNTQFTSAEKKKYKAKGLKTFLFYQKSLLSCGDDVRRMLERARAVVARAIERKRTPLLLRINFVCHGE